MVNHSGFRVSTLFHAHSAQRVALKELLGLPLPSAAVAALSCRTGRLWVERQMFFAVLLARFHQGCASGLLAGHFRSVGHLNLSFPDIRKAGWVFHHLGSVLVSLILTSPREDRPCQSVRRHSRGCSPHPKAPDCR